MEITLIMCQCIIKKRMVIYSIDDAHKYQCTVLNHVRQSMKRINSHRKGNLPLDYKDLRTSMSALCQMLPDLQTNLMLQIGEVELFGWQSYLDCRTQQNIITLYIVVAYNIE